MSKSIVSQPLFLCNGVLLANKGKNSESFHEGLDEFSNYLESLEGKESAFDAVHLNSIIDSFAPALNHHLESELQSLLELRKYGDKLPITKLWDREGFRSVVSRYRLEGKISAIFPRKMLFR